VRFCFLVGVPFLLTFWNAQINPAFLPESLHVTCCRYIGITEKSKAEALEGKGETCKNEKRRQQGPSDQPKK